MVPDNSKKNTVFHEFQSSTFDDVKHWVSNKDQNVVEETDFFVNDTKLPPALFAQLACGPSQPLPLKLEVKSLSKPFKFFRTYENVKHYAGLSSDIYQCSNLGFDFNSLVNPADLEKENKCSADQIARVVQVVNDMHSESVSWNYTFILLIAAIRLVNNARTLSTPHSESDLPTNVRSHRLRLDVGTKLAGSLAHGVTDFIVCIEHFRLVCLNANKYGFTAKHKKGSYQLLAQMVASRERVIRYYAACFPMWSLSELEELFGRYPTFGVSSTAGMDWHFVRYSKVAGKGYAKRSVDNVVSISQQMAKLDGVIESQTKPILEMLCGMLSMQIQHATEIEDIIVSRK